MKIKDLVDLKGCYSAHDVGEKEFDLRRILDHRKIKNVLDENKDYDTERVAHEIIESINICVNQRRKG